MGFVVVIVLVFVNCLYLMFMTSWVLRYVCLDLAWWWVLLWLVLLAVCFFVVGWFWFIVVCLFVA